MRSSQQPLRLLLSDGRQFYAVDTRLSGGPSAVLRNRHKTFMFTTKQYINEANPGSDYCQQSNAQYLRTIADFLIRMFVGVSTMVLDHSPTTQTVFRGRDGCWLASSLDRYLCWEKPCWIRGDY